MKTIVFDPGALRHRLRLYSPLETSDGCGGVDVTWQLVGEVWSHLKPSRITRPEEALQITEVAILDGTIRFRNDVATGWRVDFGTRQFQVQAVVDPDERKSYLVLRLEELGR